MSGFFEGLSSSVLVGHIFSVQANKVTKGHLSVLEYFWILNLVQLCPETFVEIVS